VVLVGPEDLQPRRRGHAVAQRVGPVAVDFDHGHLEEGDVRSAALDHCVHHFQRVGSLDLEPVGRGRGVVHVRPVRRLRLDVVVGGLGLVPDPVVGPHRADGGKLPLAEVEQDLVPDDVAVGVAHADVDRLGWLPGADLLEAVDRKVFEELDGVGARHAAGLHVKGLVDERRRLTHRALLFDPVRVLVREDVLVELDVDVAEVFDGTLGRTKQLR